MSSANKKLPSFLNRYIVTIVMVPSIIGIHLMWNMLQNNEALVKKDEKIELPIVTSAKYVWKKLLGDENTKTDSQEKK